MKLEDVRIAVIGLGYVGLPLAVEFGKQRSVVGFDIDPGRVAELRTGHDHTLEVDNDELASAKVMFTVDETELDRANVFIVTTPTPIDQHKQPDLRPVLSASETIGRHLAVGDIVIYESTVYPGATEEECVPVLERASGLLLNKDFFVGYSPERINPGDREHRVHNIVKITSGSTPNTADLVDELYRSIVTVGTHRAPSIKVAEAAKVIENTQRDVNIALINELAILFNKLGLNTNDVLRAADTKWNFLKFKPGLVGGHCIGVDPYYLTHKAQSVGYHPELILAGRRLNDSMAHYVVAQLLKGMAQKGIAIGGARVLILGLAFKEDTPDIRNSRVVDIVSELADYQIGVDVYDPLVDPQVVQAAYGFRPIEELCDGSYDAIILAVGHSEFRQLGADKIRALGSRKNHVLYDLMSVLPAEEVDICL
ncbi:MAG: Vi polysaccharide biosynthesis UDP-N-acetylglucosamine C-6 dehydrogenase TviB [Nigerium sp.]|nr:Vi polysaccharide biosynthesis UDP-N-acetylglucosamine C-6 dehydrogenase TviB [Nigerium sp.]